MQSVSSRIWTRIAVFISYGDNDYTTGSLIELVVIHCNTWNHLILNWIVRNGYVWSFNCVSKNVFTNHIFNIHVKTGFGIKKSWYAIKSHQAKPTQTHSDIIMQSVRNHAKDTHPNLLGGVKYFVKFCSRGVQSGNVERFFWLYLSLPSTWQDLTQDLFYRGNSGEGELEHKLRLLRR